MNMMFNYIKTLLFRKTLKGNKKGEGVATKIVGIAVGLFVCASIIPSALVAMSNESALAGVDPVVQTLFLTLLPILAVIGIAMYFLRK